jgi:hypothetical protein
MATVFLYLSVLFVVAVVIVLGVAAWQFVQGRKSMSRGHYALFITLCLAGIASMFIRVALD